jgi:integrase
MDPGWAIGSSRDAAQDPGGDAAGALGVRLRAYPTDPVLRLATAIVHRAQTRASAGGYGVVLAKVLRWFRAAGIEPLAATRLDLAYWWSSTARYAPKTRLRELAITRAFFREAIEWELLAKDPTRTIRAVPATALIETPALTLDQTRQLIESIAAELDHPDRGLVAKRDLAAIALMLRLCVRVNEAADLGWRDFSESGGERSVAFIGKWHRVSRLAVPADVWDVLTAWRDAYEAEIGIPVQPRDPVLLGLSNAEVSRARRRRQGEALPRIANGSLSRMVTARLADIGISGARMSCHALRATGGTLAFEGGADIVECQMLLRHSSLETTRRSYLKRVDERARPAMDKMGFRFGSSPDPAPTADAEDPS